MCKLLIHVSYKRILSSDNTITFYDRRNFRGAAVTIDCDKPHLGIVDNRAESAVINGKKYYCK